MSEFLSPRHEKHEDPAPYGERKVQAEHAPKSPEHERNTQEIDQIIKKIEHHAKPSAEINKQHVEAKPDHEDHIRLASAHIKSHSAKQAIQRVQKQLSPPERQFSRIVHNKTVDTISEVAGNTVARPSGLLLGGIFSLLGSIAVIVICRFYGYEYNYLIGSICFIGGFFLGLLFELLLRGKRRIS